MAFEVAFTPGARADVLRLYAYLLDRAETQEGLESAERALNAIDVATKIRLSQTPFLYRKTSESQGLRRELVIPFGAAGYVALYEIVNPAKILVLAVRHQLEEDYYG
jgi:plasmid stabilization system protein ParE